MLSLPSLMADIVNQGIVGQNQAYIWQKGLVMLGVTLIGSVAVVISGFLASQTATGLSRNLRSAIFAKIESFGQNEFNQFSTASLITRSTNDVQQLERTAIIVLRMCLQAPIMAVGAIWQAYNEAANMTWTIGLGVAGLTALILLLFILVLPKFKIAQQLVDKLNLVSRQNLTGLRVIRAFRNEPYEESKFEAANQDITKLQLFINRLLSLMQPMVSLIFNAMLLLIIWIGAGLIETNQTAIGNVMAFMQYSAQIMMSFMFMAMLMIFLPRAQVSAGRIAEVLTTKIAVQPPQNPVPTKPPKTGSVEFRQVSFAYPDAEEPILTDISFVAQPGQTTALIGSTGSGKSTLINLIPRFYDVSAGQVLVDGVDVRQLDNKQLTAAIGYVPQKGVLFSGTIASNIKFGAGKISHAAMRRAAKISQSDFINQLDGQYQFQVAQGGSNLSGGQKQRLSIARAIAKNPAIYIFDDSFSALDFKTDAALRKALASISKNKTVLIVAQRIATIHQADQIIVLDEGRIVGLGRHAELLKDCKVYQEIARSQFSNQEIKRELKVANGS
jgi:ATP-binding cassette subfamily B protein